MENKKSCKMNCKTNCPFFPQVNSTGVVDWTYDENNIKKRRNSIKFICGYDGHIIKDWNSKCPKEK